MANTEPEIGVWDSVLLEHLTEDSFIANLHHRYKHDHIYTYIGTFLVAINPYKALSIYGPEQIQCYLSKNIFKLPPHIYGVTSLAYQWLQDHNENQCIILSGESCSGKTETSRLIVHFLSQVSEARHIKRRVEQDNKNRRSFTTTGGGGISTSTKNNATHNSHSDISTSVKNNSNIFSQSHSSTTSNRVGLLKQCSIETAKSALKKCSHEKTVDFDFLHYKSTENLASTSIKCQKHSGLRTPERISIVQSPKQCLKHGQQNDKKITKQTSPGGTKVLIESCLKKSMLESNEQQKLFDTHHLPTCSKNIHHSPKANQSTMTTKCDSPNPKSPQCERCGGHTKFDSAIISTKPQCDRCGHSKCLKSCSTTPTNCNQNKSYSNQSLKSLSRSDSNCSKCNCDHTTIVKQQIRTPIMLRKKILKNASAPADSISTTINSPITTTLSSTSNSTAGGSSQSLMMAESIEMENVKIRERIAQAEVFLEAIGHATTIKNYNSSRYGKYFDIKFDYKGDPIGAHITHYMLEKTRVTSKMPGERNFHIFYQLLSGADIQFLKLLKLQRNIDKYELLNHGNATEDDKSNFSYTKKSLETLGLSQDEILSIFKIIAVVIKLGNLIFIPITNIDGTEGCQISNEYELLETAQLLNIDAQILISCLTRADSNWIHVDNGPESDAANAIRVKNSICRTIYGRLFTWIVGRINDSLKSKFCPRAKCLGILDFYGFENTDHNSFEQIGINYCNEKLHQIFLQNVLKYQQELYLREGLEWIKVDFFDNETICELIDRPSYGILSLIDEAHIVCDNALFLRLQQCCAGHPNFLSQGIAGSQGSFQIRHFAGPVTYSIQRFVEKNTDTLLRNISSGLFQSKLSIVQCLFPEGNPKRTVRKPTSLASNLRTQLQTLLSLIENRKTQYVFCLKSNEHKQARSFEMALVQHQVRYMSLMPVVALWRTGHCFSIAHSKFLQRYKLLNSCTWPHFTNGSLVEGVAIIIRGLPLPAAEFTIGTKNVFIRSPRTVFELEDFRRSRLHDLACLIQKTFRCYSKRKGFLRLRNSQITISSAWRTWRECRFGIPFTGRRHLWSMYRVAREEYRTIKHQKQSEWAVGAIQRQYIQWKRRQFLYTLQLRLPLDSSSPLSTSWVLAPRFLAETSQLLYTIFHRWRCYKYRRTFDQTARNRMREKVTASIIFKDRKASYPFSVGHPFVGDYVRLRQNVQWKKICIESNDQYVVFADIINKIARSSGKFVPILLVLSTSSMLLLDQRTLQIKYRVPATEIYRLSLSPYLDDIAVFHVRASEMGRKKGDFVFQTGHVIEIVTKLFLVIQNATTKPPEVHITTDFEANFGQQTVVFTFKCLGTSDTVQTQPKVTRKGNRMEIVI